MADAFFPEGVEKIAGATTATMGAALFHIKATIFDPISNSEIVPPKHFFELIQSPGGGGRPFAIARSTSSEPPPATQSTQPPIFTPPTPPIPLGVCALGSPISFPPGTYSLLFLPEEPTVRAGYLANREAWIDLDKKDWGPPPALSSPAPGKPSSTLSSAIPIDRRKLLRVPFWASPSKGPTGGFKVSPPAAKRFPQRGFLDASEMVPFGTPDAPWEIVLDFQWVRARVKYLFFDWQQNKEETIPPGLVVEAFREFRVAPNGVKIPDQTPVKLGAGTAISNTDGTTYLLLEGDKSMWQATQLQFRTPGQTFVDLTSKATPSPDTRLSNGTLPGSPDDRNILPPVWHTHTMRTRFTTAATTTPPPDAPWERARLTLAGDSKGDDATITFHLDDLVLGDGGGVPVKIPDNPPPKPPALFDHFLTVRRPLTNAPYQSNLTMVGLVIPADQVYTIGPPPAGSRAATPIQLSTRLVHFEGGFHDLRDDSRITGGTPGRALCLGARVAKRNAHPSTTIRSPLPSTRTTGSTNLNLQMHFVDVPGVNDPREGVPLQHLLIYLSFEFEIDKTAQPFASSDFDRLRQLLNEAAEAWSPGHPALAGPPATPGAATPVANKNYGLVPQDPAKRGIGLTVVTRFRTFFAEKTKDAQVKIRIVTDPKGADRSNTLGGQDDFLTVVFDTPQTIITYFTPSFQGDAVNNRQQFEDQGDNVKKQFTVLTHEIGHAMGLMDEYYEAFDPRVLDPTAGLTHPFMMRFNPIDEGFSDYRPFYSDASALMVSNALPRLRHFWHHAKNFAEITKPAKPPPGFKAPPDLPYVLSHLDFRFSGGAGLVYSVPPDNKKAPWVADFLDVPIPGGRGQCALFPLGDDEGSAEKMFQSPLTPFAVGRSVIERMQGVILVRSRLGFVFDASFSPPERLKQVFVDFHQKIYDTNYFSKIRFVLVGPPTAKLPRIAVLFQPLYAVANDVEAKAGKAGAVETSDIEDDMDLVFDLTKATKPARPNPFLGSIPTKKGTRLSLMQADFTFELAMRLVLGIPTALPGGAGPDLGVLRQSDIEPLARLVEQRLGEAPGTRKVEIFP